MQIKTLPLQKSRRKFHPGPSRKTFQSLITFSFFSDETVFLGPISRCPYEWPHDEICASVVHSIYVSGTEIKNTRLVTNYQLNSTHLKDMWEIYGKNLSLINISVNIFLRSDNKEGRRKTLLLASLVCVAVVLFRPNLIGH